MDFELLKKTQPTFIKGIHNAYKKNRIVQIYLFEGARGTKTIEAAYYLASLILCEGDNKPCGECLSCKRIRKDIHPRIFDVNPMRTTIKKEQVDNLEREFSLVSLEEGKRVFIIEDIDKATPAAANGLLKFLEETNAGSYGILITENLQGVLSTIRSRAQIISFSRVSKEALFQEYQAKGVDEEVARVLTTLTNDTEAGMKLIAEDKVLDTIELVRSLTKSLYDGRDPLLVMHEEGRFLIDEVNKELNMMFIDLLITITNDRLYYLLGQKEQIIFKETLDSIESVEDVDYKKTYNQIEKLLEYKQRSRYNVNTELMYMDMLIEMRKIWLKSLV